MLPSSQELATSCNAVMLPGINLYMHEFDQKIQKEREPMHMHGSVVMYLQGFVLGDLFLYSL